MPDKLASVIVTIKDRLDVTKKSVASLLSHTRYRPLQLLLVDDGSQAETKHALERIRLASHAPEDRLFVDVITNPDEAKGVAHANNLGLYHAKGETVVIADNDVIYADDWLQVGVDLINRMENVLSGVRVVSLFNYFHPNPDSIPGLFLSGGIPVFRNSYGTGCNLFFRKEFLNQLGYFPLGYPDDLYLHEQMRKLGMGKGYLITANSYVQHIGAESSLDHGMVARSLNFLGDPKEDDLCPGS